MTTYAGAFRRLNRATNILAERVKRRLRSILLSLLELANRA